MPQEDLPLAGNRAFTANAPGSTFDAIQHGTVKTKYRGVPFCKSPLDIGLYINLIDQLTPRTVIEIGSLHGGSALWFADMLTNYGVENGRVISVDIKPPKDFGDERILFLKGDAKNLGAVLPPDAMAALPHPFLVVEDSSHYYPETYAVLEFFAEHCQSGDYVVVEDGIVSLLSGPGYRQYEGGPNRAIADFMASNQAFEIDENLCDFYGYNMTYCLNGWLRKI